ncbi:hypothetical protein N4T77_08410 [Clostridium sp. CX1]|uniref:hypothetical protein n=1 Tax=Clostridium sp. CX1 TaxID=2978346 RepID=UPI0021C19F89|nr:hypothetical protein [Clostridium sp. CX1]MCT8976617.1 hypothetical protein [Clostridium sp. CX1]
MKELLSKLVKNHVAIFFKSGDHIESVVIQAVVGNVLVASSHGKILFIEIPHIAYVVADDGAVDAIKEILRSQQEKGEDKKGDKKDGKKDDKKDDKKDGRKDGKKR